MKKALILAVTISLLSLFSWRLSAISFIPKSNFPVRIDDAFVVSSSENIYVLNFDGFWQYSPGSDLWAKKADFPVAGAYSLTGFSIGTKVYFGFGKYNGQSIMDRLYCYDPSTDSWSETQAIPTVGRSNPNSFVIGNCAYIMGGIDASKKDRNEMWKYDSSTDSWSQVTPLPVYPSRFGHATLINNGKAVIISGEYIDVSMFATYLLSDIWTYDPSTDKWTEGNFINFKYTTSSFTINGTGYIFESYKSRLYTYSFEAQTRSFFAYMSEVSYYWDYFLNIGDRMFLLKYSGVFQELSLDLAPSSLSLSLIDEGIPENAGTGYWVGTLSAEGGADDFYEFSVAPDKNGNRLDNDYFEIHFNYLYLKKTVNYEETDTLKVSVKATNNAGYSLIHTISIPVVNVNEAPEITGISNTIINEETFGEWSSEIQTNASGDESSLSFSLFNSDQEQGADNKYFNITGNTLFCHSLPEFENKDSLNVAIKVTNNNGESQTGSFVLYILKGNYFEFSPSDILCSTTESAIPELSAIGTVMGIFSAFGGMDTTIVFTLSPNEAGDELDNDFVEITSGNLLCLSKEPDYETDSVIDVSIRATNGLGFYRIETFSFDVLNVNEAPEITGISETIIHTNDYLQWSAEILLEPGYNVSEYEFSLVESDKTSGADNSYFELSENVLYCIKNPEYSEKNFLSIAIQVIDNHNEYRIASFSVEVQKNSSIYGLDSQTGFNPIIMNQYITISTCLDEPVIFEVIDLKGSKIKSGTLFSGDQQINTKQLNTGFYILKLKSNSKAEVIKFHKNR